jgi:hypothetical protein
MRTSERKLTYDEIKAVVDRVEHLKTKEMQDCRLDFSRVQMKYKHGPPVSIRIAKEFSTAGLFKKLDIPELETYYSNMKKRRAAHDTVCDRYRKLIKALGINGHVDS